MIENNENISICSSCGSCCKSLPGILSPDDMKEITVDSLEKMYEKGYQFDYWEGNPTENPEYDDITFYFLRPQTKKSLGKVLDPSWGGECIFLTDKGCTMSFEERPAQCRDLKPSKDGNCSGSKNYTKAKLSEAWLPYYEIIKETIHTILNKKD